MTSTERQEPIQKCFRSLAFISKFIVQSRQLFARATQGQNEDGFRMDVHLLFNSFNKMLSVSYETILPAQILFLEHIHSTYPNFLKELSSLDLAKLVTLMLDSVTKDAKLMNAKLKALAHVVKSQIFQDSESRALLLPTCCEHLKMHLLGREELRLCSDILGDIIEFLSGKSDPNEQDSVHRDINVLVEIIMQPLAHTLINMEKDILSTIVVCCVYTLCIIQGVPSISKKGEKNRHNLFTRSIFRVFYNFWFLTNRKITLKLSI